MKKQTKLFEPPRAARRRGNRLGAVDLDKLTFTVGFWDTPRTYGQAEQFCKSAPVIGKKLRIPTAEEVRARVKQLGKTKIIEDADITLPDKSLAPRKVWVGPVVTLANMKRVAYVTDGVDDDKHVWEASPGDKHATMCVGEGITDKEKQRSAKAYAQRKRDEIEEAYQKGRAERDKKFEAEHEAYLAAKAQKEGEAEEAKLAFTNITEFGQTRKDAERYCKKLPVVGKKARLPTFEELKDHYTKEPPAQPDTMTSWVADREDGIIRYSRVSRPPEWRLDYASGKKAREKVVCAAMITEKERAASEAEGKKRQAKLKKEADERWERLMRGEAPVPVAEPEPVTKTRLCPIKWS